MPALKPGTKIPALELSTLSGSKLRASDLKPGELAVLAFFKETCPTCQLGVPFIERLAAHHRSDPRVHVWGIAQEPKDRAEAFVKAYRLQFPTLLDSSPFSVSKAFGLTNVPTVFLVDDKGTVLQTIIGFVKKEYEDLAERVAKLVGTTSAPLFAGVTVPDYKPG